jgi:hypothetical protein
VFQFLWEYLMTIRNRIRDFFAGDVRIPNTPEPVPSTALEERQQLLAHHVRLVARRMTNGLFCFGKRGGLGKTRVILKTLTRCGTRPVILTGHVTPLALYTALYQNQDSIIFLDDCDSLYRNLPALGILRSALWGENNEKRLVTYNSSQLKIPSSFHFSGALILTGNTLPRKNHAFEAVLSRVDVFELDATNDEVIEMMRRLAVEGFDGLTAAECLQVVDFVAEFSATRELSLRLLEPSYRKVIYARQSSVDWRDLVRSQLEQLGSEDRERRASEAKAFEMACLDEVLKQFPESVVEQQKAWCEMTLRSRATFFRLKKAYQAERPVPPPTEPTPPSDESKPA